MGGDDDGACPVRFDLRGFLGRGGRHLYPHGLQFFILLGHAPVFGLTPFVWHGCWLVGAVPDCGGGGGGIGGTDVVTQHDAEHAGWQKSDVNFGL